MTTKANPPTTEEVIRGAIVLITGGARGMGELYARRAVAAGAAAIALWDVDAERANALAAELERPGMTVRAYAVDLGDRVAITESYARTVDEIGSPDVLINNAGIVRGALFWDHDSERDIEPIMRVNTLGPMWLTREALPAMMADRSRPKRILNVASAAGMLPNPRMSVYASSKWAMLGWSDSLRLELEREDAGRVKVTTFCPSYISTGMFAGARGPRLTPIMTPRAAVDAAWRGMIQGKPLVSKPWTVKLSMAFRGILPVRAWDFVAGKIFRVYSSMDRFTGRG